MKRSIFLFSAVFLTLFLTSVTFPVPAFSQDENTQWGKMLAGLKNPERPQYDAALDYLNWVKTSVLCPLSLKKQLDYQAALVHLDAVENGAMFLPREEHTKKCRELLEKFLKENPQTELAFETQSTLGRLYMEDGRIAVIKSGLDSVKEPEKKTLAEQARASFQKSLPYFEAADKIATEKAKKLQAMQKANSAAVKESALTGAYGHFLAGKMLVNTAKADIAKTYPKNSKEFKDGLTAVAVNYEDLSKKYSGFSVSFTAKLYAAKIYKELGDFKKVRGMLGELNVLQGDEYLDILSESLMLALEMNLIEKKPENYLDSINRARAWNDNAPATSKIAANGQKIFLLGAKNFIAYADSPKITRQDKDKALRDAGIFLRQIRPNSANPAPAREARELLGKIGAIKIDRSVPENYAQAKEFADEDWRAFALAYTDFQSAKGADKDKAKSQLDVLGKACVASFNKAINMREDDTPQTDINALRQQLVSVYWFQGKILEAALLADYLVQHYSNSPNADKTAVQAVRLYRQVFVEDKLAGHDPSAIAVRLDKLCKFILKRWEGQEVTGEVQLLQIETAIDNGDIESAKKLLAETKEGTPQRISAELKIGQSLWNRYAALNKLPEDSEERPDAKKLEELLADAKKYLEIGLNGKVGLIKDGKIKPDTACVQCAAALAQICTNTGQSEAAIKWLKDPLVGPLALIANPPATVSVDTLKALQLGSMMCNLRAYVGIGKLDEAEKTMNELENVIKEQAKEGDGSAEEQRLTMIYVALGRQLEDRLKELTAAGKEDEAKKVADGFKLFLERIKARGDSNTFQSLYWVADTFYRLGSGMSTDKNVPEDAKGYYKLAGGTYVDILKRINGDEKWAPEKAADTITIRLAESLRSIGLYAPAMKYLKTVLEDSENRIDLQIEAAKNLEQWGIKAKDEEEKKNLIRSVTGIPQEKVWGWNGLIKRTSINIDKFAPVYYEAYLSKFRCFIELGRDEKDKEKKVKFFDTAERDIGTLIQMRPQLGGQDWYPLFDTLYKQLERAKGKNSSGGLKGFAARMGEQPQETVKPADANTDAKNTAAANTETAESADAPLQKTANTKAKEKKKEKEDAQNMASVYFGIAAAIVIIPVIILFTRKKKK